MNVRRFRWSLVAAAGAALAGIPAAADQPGYGQGYGPGYGMGQGHGQGAGPCWDGRQGSQGYGMGPGMMRQGQMGPGMTGPQPGGPGQPGQGFGQPRFMMRFATIDADQNGAISAEEAAEQAEAVFAAMDGDEDEAVTLEEFLSVDMGMGPAAGRPGMAERRQARREARFKQLDANGDGSVTHEELLTAEQQRFASGDRNRDGQVDPFEFRASRGPF